MLLDGEAFCAAHMRGSRAFTIGTEHAPLAIVRKIGRQYSLANALSQLRIFQGKERFNTLVQVTQHPVRVSQIDFAVPTIFKIKDAAVFQEAANNASYPDAAAEAPAQGRPWCGRASA